MKNIDSSDKISVAGFIDLALLVGIFYSLINISLFNQISFYVLIAFGLIYIFHKPFFYTSKWQATIGQRIMKIYASDKNDSKLSFWQAINKAEIYFLMFYAAFITLRIKYNFSHDIFVFATILLVSLFMFYYIMIGRKKLRLIYLRDGRK